MLHFHRSRFLHLYGVGGKHTGYFRIQIFGRNLFSCSRLGLEKRIAVIEGDFMPGSLSLVSEVNRHLPFVVVSVLGHTHTLGVNLQEADTSRMRISDADVPRSSSQ